jgi:hypothetical protein
VAYLELYNANAASDDLLCIGLRATQCTSNQEKQRWVQELKRVIDMPEGDFASLPHFTREQHLQRHAGTKREQYVVVSVSQAQFALFDRWRR